VTLAGNDRTSRAVDQGRFGFASSEREHLLRHGVRAADHALAARGEGGLVGAAHDVGRQYGEQGAEVAAAGGGEEGFDDAPLLAPGRGRRDAPYPVPRPAGELLGGDRRTVENQRDLVEGHGEQVVEYEGDPLRGSQPVQHHEHRASDRLDELGLFLRAPYRGRVLIQGFLAP
jgi:hypothetical protein